MTRRKDELTPPLQALTSVGPGAWAVPSLQKRPMSSPRARWPCLVCHGSVLLTTAARGPWISPGPPAQGT